MKLRTALRAMLAGWEKDMPAAWRQVIDGTRLDWKSRALDHDMRPGEIIVPGRRGAIPPAAPKDAHLFRAFENAHPDSVRAILLGQDPYPNPGWATGRAFEQGNLAKWPDDPQQVADSLRRLVQAIVSARTGNVSYAAGDRAWKALIHGARLGRIRLETPGRLFDYLEGEGVLFDEVRHFHPAAAFHRPGGASALRMQVSDQEVDMCDYSLMGVPNRLAREAEQLIVHRFPTGTLGLASPEDLNPSPDSKHLQARAFWSTLREFFSPPESQSPPAVCIPPGAILMLHDIPTKLQSELGIGPDERVTFTQTTAAANQYRDAVRFEGGREVRLQDLSVGQRVEVIDLTLAQDRETDRTEPDGLPVRRSW